MDVKKKSIDVSLDELIASTIYVLNEKGYKTKSSCTGHEESYRQYFYFYGDFNNLMNMNLSDIEIIKKKDNFYLCRYLAYCNTCYICFEDDYVFSELPKNFISRGRIIISSFSYSNFDNSKKSDEEIHEHIKKINEELYLWSVSLQSIDDYTLKK